MLGKCKKVERKQSPRGIDRVDSAHDSPNTKDHVHFDDGTSLNWDGTIHDAKGGVPDPTSKQSRWLDENG